MKPALALAVLLFASTVNADAVPTATPIFEEVLPELALIGNDVLFQNVTPATLQAAIDAEDAILCPGACMTTSPEYQFNFYSDGSAFGFQVPFGTTVDSPVPTPEPESLLLLAMGLSFMVFLRVFQRMRQPPL